MSPYVPEKDRPELDKFINQMPELKSIGELNYIITRIIVMTNPLRYADCNSIVGLIWCIVKEMYRRTRSDGLGFWLTLMLGLLVRIALSFYRRVVAPYEDKKRKLNGDVFE